VNADALSSVGNSLVGAVIGSAKFSRSQEGAPLLSREHIDHEQSAVVRNTIRYDTIGEFNVDLKAEYTA